MTLGLNHNAAAHITFIKKYIKFLEGLDQEQADFLSSLAEEVSLCESLSPIEKAEHRAMIEVMGKIWENVQTLKWISEHFKILHEMGQTFSKTFEKQEIYQKAFELVSRVMDTDAFFIAFYDEEKQEIDIPFMVDNHVKYESRKLKLGEGNVSRVILSRQTVHLKTEEDLAEESIRWGNPSNDTHTCIFVPILFGDQIKGVISAQSYHRFAYRKEHEDLLKIIGMQVASAIENADLYDKLYLSSLKDELTQIKNYRAFHKDMEQLIETLPEGECFTLAMFDSDNLKQVNDLYGHNMGDMLVQRIAEALRSVCTNGVEAYRYAGDEFMLIGPRISVEGMLQKIKEIKQYLLEHPLEQQGTQIYISLSGGIAEYPTHAKTPDDLKKVADQALYHSKKHGKNSITVYHPELRFEVFDV